MFRSASRLPLRSLVSSPVTRAAFSRRFVGTAAPAQKPRSWKSSALRWGLAATAVYYYNTHDVFAEDPAYAPVAHEADDSDSLPTIEQIAARRRQRLMDTNNPSSNLVQAPPLVEAAPDAEAEHGAVEDLEEEASQQGAFNPETGEINWDCPCLGGMAHGPCGEEFKAAFSCFVYSNEEPKGMDCIDKFKGMQDCFRRYPDVYGAELEDDDDDMNAAELETPASTPDGAVGSAIAPEAQPAESALTTHERAEKATNELAAAQSPQVEQTVPAAGSKQANSGNEQPSQKDEEIPKIWHDTRGDNEGK